MQKSKYLSKPFLYGRIWDRVLNGMNVYFIRTPSEPLLLNIRFILGSSHVLLNVAAFLRHSNYCKLQNCCYWKHFLLLADKAHHQLLSRGLSWRGYINALRTTAAAWVQTRVWSCGTLWWTKVALGQVSSENFGFPCQSTFHLLLHNHLH
jgi:hypothetical protein